MGRTGFFLIIFTIVISFSSLTSTFGQTTGETEPSQGTDIPQSAPNYPIIDNAGIVYPREDLDPFGYSTLGGTSGLGDWEDTSTLGTDTKRKSNIEVNKPRERKTVEEVTGATEEQTETGFTEPEPDSEPQSIGYTSPARKGGLYTWKDENGVVHVTNDLGSVPLKYQDQVIKESQE
jgi:hypothetical protein